MRDEDEPLDGFDTAPPPAGADDLYGAPTRVARVPENLLDELMKSRSEALDAPLHDLSALAAAASHAVAPPRAGAPAAGALAIDPMLPANASEPDVHVPFGLDDPGIGEAPSAPGTGHAGTPRQSGQTVPLSAALLASVIRSVEEKRAGAATVPAPALSSEVPVPKRRSLFTLALILAIGVGVFVTGVIMFLDVLR